MSQNAKAPAVNLSKPIVRAIDVGYGNTKFVSFHRADTNEIQCSLFPSIAPHASATDDLAGGVFQRRNTVRIEVNGVVYEVGKDARLAQDASYSRTLTSDYSMSDPYLAMLRGAMFYMAVPHIDLLVVGLPVNTVDIYGEKLRSRLLGSHTLPKVVDGVPTGESYDVEVRDVRVVAQPIGGFFDYSISNNLYGKMRNQMNLLIDPGYYTLDWLVAAGVKTVSPRSGAHSGGMSAVLGAIAEAIGKKLGTQITDVTGIDEALRTGTNPRFFGQEFEIADYVNIGKEKARQFVRTLAGKVGNKGVDIDNIILAGGGADFFKDIISESFPHHELVVTKDPVFANVRGFQLAGAQWAHQDAFISKREVAAK